MEKEFTYVASDQGIFWQGEILKENQVLFVVSCHLQ